MKLALALCALLALAGASTIAQQAAAQIVSGSGGTAGTSAITPPTIVTLPAATSTQLVAANPLRRYLKYCNIGGANPMTVIPGAGPAIAGQGPSYDPGSSANNQGGCETFEGSFIPGNAFQAISTGGTTVSVWEGQ